MSLQSNGTLDGYLIDSAGFSVSIHIILILPHIYMYMCHVHIFRGHINIMLLEHFLLYVDLFFMKIHSFRLIY